MRCEATKSEKSTKVHLQNSFFHMTDNLLQLPLQHVLNALKLLRQRRSGKLLRKFNKMKSLHAIAITFVCLAGPLPIVNRQKAFVLPIACFKLFPRLIVTVKQPGKQCNRLSALSWKLGGQVFISICRVGMASAAIMD